MSLYKEIWDDPVSKVALKYGVSDTTIRKRCIYYGIPLPYRGYWEKLKAGQNVKKIEMPDIDGDLRRRITNYFINYISDINQISDEDLEFEDDLIIFSDNTKVQIKQKCNEIRIGNTLHKPHNLINTMKS